MRIIWISLYASLMITLVDAQRNFNFSKPIVSLEKRPRTPTWQRPPEERRKLSIFPRNNKKFIVTPNTVPRTEEKAVGLSMNRPVMREFVVQDKSEQGAWYFAPRKPLMKIRKFTVNDAPQINHEMKDKSNSNSKPFAEVVESKKMNLVNHIKNEQINKVQINKGNLINVWQNIKENLTTSKDFKPVGKVQEEKLNNYVSNVVPNNDAKNDDYSVSSDSKTNMTIIDVAQINHELEDKTSTKVIQAYLPVKIKDKFTEIVQERSPDFNEMKLIDNVKNNIKIETSLNDKTNVSFNLDELEVLTENITNDTKNFSVATSNIPDNKPEDVISSKPQEIEEDLDKDIVEDYTDEPLTITTNSMFEPMIFKPDLNNGLQTESFTEFIFDNVENSSTEEAITEIETPDSQNSEEIHEPFIDESTSQISDDLMHEQAELSDEMSQEVTIDNLYNVTSEEILNEPSIDKSNNFNAEDVSSEFMIDNSNNLTVEDISNEWNMAGEDSNEYLIGDLSGEISDESLVDKSKQDVSDEPTIESKNMSAEEISIEPLVDRYKRSNNIIEEENRATTITNFKYTGQPTRLSQDLSFKNINA